MPLLLQQLCPSLRSLPDAAPAASPALLDGKATAAQFDAQTQPLSSYMFAGTDYSGVDSLKASAPLHAHSDTLAALWHPGRPSLLRRLPPAARAQPASEISLRRAPCQVTTHPAALQRTGFKQRPQPSLSPHARRPHPRPACGPPAPPACRTLGASTGRSLARASGSGGRTWCRLGGMQCCAKTCTTWRRQVGTRRPSRCAGGHQLEPGPAWPFC